MGFLLAEGAGETAWADRAADMAVPRPVESAEVGAPQEAGTGIRAMMIDLSGHPPSVPPRPFNKDYPMQPRTDAAGRLLHDIEGRDLKAKFIAGRRKLGAPD